MFLEHRRLLCSPLYHFEVYMPKSDRTTNPERYKAMHDRRKCRLEAKTCRMPVMLFTLTTSRKNPSPLIGSPTAALASQLSTSHLSAGIVTTSQSHTHNDARLRARPPHPGQVDRRFRKLPGDSVQPLAASWRYGGRWKDGS